MKPSERIQQCERIQQLADEDGEPFAIIVSIINYLDDQHEKIEKIEKHAQELERKLNEAHATILNDANTMVGLHTKIAEMEKLLGWKQC